MRTESTHESAQTFCGTLRRQRGIDDDYVAPAVRQNENAPIVRNVARLAGLVREAIAFVEPSREFVVPLLREERLQEPRTAGGFAASDPFEQVRRVARRMGVAAGRAGVLDERLRQVVGPRRPRLILQCRCASARRRYIVACPWQRSQLMQTLSTAANASSSGIRIGTPGLSVRPQCTHSIQTRISALIHPLIVS